MQETARMHSLLRHFGNCQESAVNGGYEATVVFFIIFFLNPGVNSTDRRHEEHNHV